MPQGKTIKKIYQNAGLTPPKGKGIHSQKFHEMAVAIKEKNPSYPMSRAYQIAMGQLGRNKAVNKSHWSENVAKRKTPQKTIRRQSKRKS